MAVEVAAPVAALPGWYRAGRSPRYCKGPSPPRSGDLTETAFVLFGP